jgi:hypothetical protein
MDRLDILCKPSFLHFSLLSIVHGIAGFSLFQAQQFFWLEFVLAVFIGISFWHFSRLALMSHPLSIVRVQGNEGDWQITLRDGETRRVSQSGEILVWPWLVVAFFRDGKHRKENKFYPLVLMPDSVSVFDHRRSRIYFSFYGFQDK